MRASSPAPPTSSRTARATGTWRSAPGLIAAPAPRHPPAGRCRTDSVPLDAQPGAAHGANHVHTREEVVSRSRTLISHARVVSCSGDPTERPFDGDILLEGDRIAGVFRGRAPIDPPTVREVD